MMHGQTTNEKILHFPELFSFITLLFVPMVSSQA
jgi:hypothetical protein